MTNPGWLFRTNVSRPICQFPKHRGKDWVDVVDEDREFCEWIVSGEHEMVIEEVLYDYLMDLLEDY